MTQYKLLPVRQKHKTKEGKLVFCLIDGISDSEDKYFPVLNSYLNTHHGLIKIDFLNMSFINPGDVTSVAVLVKSLKH